MKCSGRDISGNGLIELRFDRVINSVDPVLGVADPGDNWIAPGFIDLQVNGFAGVDYNHPGTSHEEIARSLRAQFATGVTRLYPTVITGGPAEMLACLRNLAVARECVTGGRAIDGFHVEGPHI